MTIVYNTNTGTTQKYAEALAEKLGCEAVKLTKAGDVTDEVIFMSWIMMGDIATLADARSKFNIKAVIAVGCMSIGEDKREELTSKNNITEQFFVLPGNFSIDNLSGMYKMMMKMAVNMMKSKIKNSDDPKDAQAMALFEKGIEMYDESKLDAVAEALK